MAHCAIKNQLCQIAEKHSFALCLVVKLDDVNNMCMLNEKAECLAKNDHFVPCFRINAMFHFFFRHVAGLNNRHPDD